jgi:hypothetical protein
LRERRLGVQSETVERARRDASITMSAAATDAANAWALIDDVVAGGD